jgi:hypothetical protein
MTAKHLIIPPALKWKAKELLESELDPDTANNAKNTLKNELTYTVCHFLTSTTGYTLLTDKQYHDLRFIWRRKPKTQMGVDIWTGNKVYKLTCRNVADFVYFYGVWHNAGA